jgi:hypothetical protein
MSITPPTTPQGPEQYWQPPAPPAPPVSGPEAGQKSWVARHKILTGLLVLAGLGFLGSALGGNSAQTTGSAASAGSVAPPVGQAPGPEQDAALEDAAQEDAAAPAAKVGAAVRDGQFEFTVTKVEKGVKRVGSSSFGQKPQGQYVLVHVKVKNIGTEAQTLFDSEQMVRDGEGREFSADTSAGMHVEDNDVFINEVNPGNVVVGTLVYDMPKDASPTSIELHDSMFSDGVVVSLR